MQKTGQCFHRDQSEKLWLAESFVDEYEYVSTQDTEVFEQEPTQGDDL